MKPNSQLSRVMRQLALYVPDRHDLRPYYFTSSFWFRLDAIPALLVSISEEPFTWADTGANVIDLVMETLTGWLGAIACNLLLCYTTFVIVQSHPTPVSAAPASRRLQDSLIVRCSDAVKAAVLNDVVLKYKLPAGYMQRGNAVIGLHLIHDAVAYWLLSYGNASIWHQMLVYILTSVLLAPLSAICTQNIILKQSQATHCSGMSLLSLWQILLIPASTSASIKALAIFIIAQYIDHAEAVVEAVPRSTYETAYPGITYASKAARLSIMLWPLLNGPAMMALISAESVIVPPTASTILPVDRSGLAAALSTPAASSSTIAQSTALAIWSWKGITLRKLWSVSWRCLLMGFLALWLMPLRKA